MRYWNLRVEPGERSGHCRGSVTLDENEIRALALEVKRGRLGRRAFVRTLVGLGLTAPLARQVLTSAELQISPCCPEATMWVKNSSPHSLSALTTGASLIASGRVPTMISQRNPGALFGGMSCMRPFVISSIPNELNIRHRGLLA